MNDWIPPRPKDADTEVQYHILFPKGWHLNLCLRWLKLRRIIVPIGHTEADAYGHDSIYATNPNAPHGYWVGPSWDRLRYCFKKLLNPRV